MKACTKLSVKAMALHRLIPSLLLAACCASSAAAQALDPALLNALPYRNLGPFRAGSWVVAAAIPETPPKAHRDTIYAALRTGGVWKSSNGGVTFEPVLDAHDVYSIGAIAVAPSDENVVWVGTGDNSATRSAYWGDGVYRSTDAGKTWQNMGLKDTQHIARIVIHPTRPDTVWVAALGHLATANAERGVFKTTDGGKHMAESVYVGDRVGAVDLVLDPRNPAVLYAATYEHQRLAWVINDGGPGTGIYKTTDGGANWKELDQRTSQGPDGPHRDRPLPHASQTPSMRSTTTTTSVPAPPTRRHHQRPGLSQRRCGAPLAARQSRHGRCQRQGGLLLQPGRGGPQQCRAPVDHGLQLQLLGGWRAYVGRARRSPPLRARLWRFPLAVDRPAGFRPHDRDL